MIFKSGEIFKEVRVVVPIQHVIGKESILDDSRVALTAADKTKDTWRHFNLAVERQIKMK